MDSFHDYHNKRDELNESFGAFLPRSILSYREPKIINSDRKVITIKILPLCA